MENEQKQFHKSRRGKLLNILDENSLVIVLGSTNVARSYDDAYRFNGPTGNYLNHPHTMAHFKEPHYSKLADKAPYAVWMKKGGKTMEQRAADMVDKILTSHIVEPLSDEVQRKIKEIVEREQTWVDNKK